MWAVARIRAKHEVSGHGEAKLHGRQACTQERSTVIGVHTTTSETSAHWRDRRLLVKDENLPLWKEGLHVWCLELIRRAQPGQKRT